MEGNKLVAPCSALIVEGGAMRSVFSAGLLDGFLKYNFNPFDFYIGVSAGAFNLATYIANLPGKSMQIFENFALQKNFISFSRLILGGNMLDLDWLYDTVMRQSIIDTTKVFLHSQPLIVCTTDVETGSAVFHDTSPENLMPILKASMALPLLYRQFPVINGRSMSDGGIADGIPVSEAIRRGANRILVIRSRHHTYRKKDTLGHKLIRWKMRNYPMLRNTMCERVNRFNAVIHLMRNPPEGIVITEICPPEDFTIGRFSQNRQELHYGYDSGFSLAENVIQKWSINLQANNGAS